MKMTNRLAVVAASISVMVFGFASGANASGAVSIFPCVPVNVDTCTVTIPLTSNMNEQVGSTMPDNKPWSMSRGGRRRTLRAQRSRRRDDDVERGGWRAPGHGVDRESHHRLERARRIKGRSHLLARHVIHDHDRSGPAVQFDVRVLSSSSCRWNESHYHRRRTTRPGERSPRLTAQERFELGEHGRVQLFDCDQEMVNRVHVALSSPHVRDIPTFRHCSPRTLRHVRWKLQGLDVAVNINN